MGRLVFHGGIFVFLTLLTQIGGLVYAVNLLLGKPIRNQRTRILLLLFTFPVLYLSAQQAAERIAPSFGRYPLTPSITTPATGGLRTLGIIQLLNRHYVSAKMNRLAVALSDAVSKRFGKFQTTNYLDANFPFLNGFPLLPHLSHNDGHKLDLSFAYESPATPFAGEVVPSPFGYWAFEVPSANTVLPCVERSDWFTLRWDMTWFQRWIRPYSLDEERTRFILQWLVDEGQKYGLEKVLIEPHIAKRLKVSSDLIRFQGCRAARHDDHIHVQISD